MECYLVFLVYNNRGHFCPEAGYYAGLSAIDGSSAFHYNHIYRHEAGNGAAEAVLSQMNTVFDTAVSALYIRYA